MSKNIHVKSGFKKIVFLILSIFLLGFVLPRPTFAHFEAADGNFSAVLHMDPDDDPIVQEITSFYIDIHDSKKTFDLNKCHCMFSVYEHGKLLSSQQVAQLNTSRSPAAIFSFPKADVYVLEFAGQPTMHQLFQPFRLTWDVRVDRTGNVQPGSTGTMDMTNKNRNSSMDRLPTLIIGLVFIVAVLLVGFFSLKRK